MDLRMGRNVSQEILDLAKAQADEIIKDKTKIVMPPEITGLEEEGPKRTEYLLVQDYLQTLGIETTPEVLRFESLHPTVEEDRRSLAQRLALRSYDKTPLLVQLIAIRLAQVEQMDKEEKEKNLQNLPKSLRNK